MQPTGLGSCHNYIDGTQEDNKYNELKHMSNTGHMSNIENNLQTAPVHLPTVAAPTGSNKFSPRPPYWRLVVVVIGLIIVVMLIAILAFVATSPCQCSTTEMFPATSTPSPKKCIPLYMTLKIDDYGEVFADGVLLLKDQRGSTVIRTLLIPCDTRVLAFELFNIGAQITMSASISNGIRTDGRSSWKCSDHFVNGWNKADFDDSSWTEAEVIEDSPFHYDTCADCRHISCGTGSGPKYIRTTL